MSKCYGAPDMVCSDVVWRLFTKGEGSEKERNELVKCAYHDLDTVLNEVAKRVGGEVVPDTVAAAVKVEVVFAALAYMRAKKVATRLKVLIPSEPVPGWIPLVSATELFQEQGLATVYRVPFYPSLHLHARQATVKVARTLIGLSAKVVDITDASPLIVVALHPAGVRTPSIMIHTGYAALFQKLSFTVRVR